MCPVTVFEQDGYDLRVERGLDGVRVLGPHCAGTTVLAGCPRNASAAAGDQVPELLAGSVSGRELVAAGVPDDVRLASDVDTSTVVPVLTSGVFAA
jgi:phosphosulfolactate phosphohydrolase-like enzyme